jgi:DNA-binding transcriptional LysR family regulator
VLAAFRREHPNIDIELVLSSRSQDLLRREADIAVRMVKPKQGALTAKKLGAIHLGLHAHPSYLKAHGAPRSLAELREHPMIGFDNTATIGLPKLELPITRELFAFRCDSDVGQYAAIRAGFGIGMCQVALAKRDYLVPVLPNVMRVELGVWVVMHKDLKQTVRMRLMFAHLAAHLQAYIASE